jgi:E3 ubiquitin-protein ligase TRIP12
LKESIKFDHGYSVHSRLARDFLDVLLEFTVQQRQKFIMFVTGSKLLPAKNGLKALEPPLTVVRKTVDQSNSVDTDLHLPSVMTCVNYLKIPEYSSKDVLHRQLLYAIDEGQQSFHLS